MTPFSWFHKIESFVIFLDEKRVVGRSFDSHWKECVHNLFLLAYFPVIMDTIFDNRAFPSRILEKLLEYLM